MTIKEAIMLLNPKTTASALAEIEYYNGFSGKEACIEAIEDACRLAIEALEKQATIQATSEWIPVSERLPEEYESVLFSTHFGGVKFGYITSYREWKDEAEGYTHCDDEVTAWQPIPEPWKENTDE